MSEEEEMVIEAAVEVAFLREARRHGPILPEHLEAELMTLERAVSALHNANDGRWTPS